MGEPFSILNSASDVSVWGPHSAESPVAMGSPVASPSRRPSDEARLAALDAECASLRESNAALSAAVERLRSEKKAAEEAFVTNVQKVLLPVLQTLQDEVRPDQRKHVAMLKTNLLEMSAPLADSLSRAFMRLTAVELRICQMIRDGRTTKEIAELRRVSPATVARQRERIRHKLGLTGSDANLGTYLRNFLVERS